MSFAQDSGYIPATIAQLMAIIRENINTQFGTTYDEETFVGTNFYKYFYALVQRLQEQEIKSSEIFLRMQEYFTITNAKIRRPNTTAPGLLDILTDAGYSASVKEPLDADAGKVFVCVDVDHLADEYAATKLAICTLIKNSVAAGVISQGSEIEAITLENLQSFNFKYDLPDRVAVRIRLTTTLSDNNEYSISAPAVVKTLLMSNIVARYGLGRDFEPQRYFSVIDAPWAAAVLLEYSLDAGLNWLSTIYEAAYDDIFTYAIGDVTIVEA